MIGPIWGINMQRKAEKNEKGYLLTVTDDQGKVASKQVCKRTEEWEFEAHYVRLIRELRR